jgi:hypothetical protein
MDPYRDMNVKSNRNPENSTYFNNADQNHRVWGFVIFRCAYHSDRELMDFMHHLGKQIEKKLEFCNVRDILIRLSLTLVQDKSLHDVSIATIRGIFKEWIAAVNEEGQRDRFCV